MRWPKGHKFAFTVVDDTDSATIENVKPVYDLLAGLGLKTTKTAWVFRGGNSGSNSASTCEDREYLDWLLSLQAQGFEIAFHNAAPSTSQREKTRLGLERFGELFGPQPILFCNHGNCEENLYWGEARLSGWRRILYNLVTRGRKRSIGHGHADGDPLFWGDLCKQHVRYVRNFVFDDLDALTVCPEQPYHDPSRPYVNFWFTSADGADLERFLANFTVKRLERLEDTGGLCIAYAHFAYEFVENGTVNAEFRKRLEFLATLNGWFAPASQVLDYLRQGAANSQRIITPKRLRQLEGKWLFEKMLKGTT
jgi:hypothetical protein